ncbi:MAG: multifunctional oxoglutarate decarboxylase/oxoglutarate dehydrogenase thiamine pyrophosphate-binding subunit/dihydrolipoyllysine-residue succinyltransferase subunit [Bryobacteraceae bacterium]
MSPKTEPPPNINSWLEEELYHQYRHDRRAVDEAWHDIFESNGETVAGAEEAAFQTAAAAAVAEPAALAPPPPPPPTAPPSPVPPGPKAPAPKAEPAAEKTPATQTTAIATHQPALQLRPSEQLVPLRGASGRLAANMTASLAVPTATSQRAIPVKVIEENRRILNQYRELQGKSKISYTHLLAWAITQAVKAQPSINDAYAEQNGEPFRLVRKEVNIGLAVDVAGPGGSRSLVVPSIKNAGAMTFDRYMAAFDDLVQRARKAKLTVDDFVGTTISLTNPGTVGTMGSVPRLMPGQGCIIASGAIDYPPEYQGARPELLAALGLSKVMTLTCTYDHRIIQGAESGAFLGKLQDLLFGATGFYEEIFEALRIPARPMHWEADRPNVPAVHAPGYGLPANPMLAAAPALSGSVSGVPALPGTSATYGAPVPPKEAAILQLINSYRVRGHLIADINPLGGPAAYHPELDPATYGFSIWDLDREFITGNLGWATGESSWKPVATLREILETLRNTYCGRITCEYMSIQHPEQKSWLQQRMEPHGNAWPLTPDNRIRTLERLIAAEQFESFIHSRFVGQKRFSLEGAETAIAMLDELLDLVGDDGGSEVVIGMAHRGRLNVLANAAGKRMSQIFSEFEGHPDPNSTQGSGDVKYHLGATGMHRSQNTGHEVVVSVAPNPSHLEAVNPVVEGIVRAKQTRTGDARRERVIPVLLHGDAAFAGQGVVTETLNLSQLHGYRTGGTVHVIINNQIGFTTNPQESRSSVYCSDIARMVQAPIFHVNGDDPEACVRAIQVAFDFRQKFKKDVVIDMICYRRHGHNEGDDPSFTQPLMYRQIKDHPPISNIYAERLIREKVVTPEQVERFRKRIALNLDDGFDEAKQYPSTYEVEEIGIVDDLPPEPETRTAVSRDLLDEVVEALTTVPDSFTLHPKLSALLEKRKTALDSGVDWALAEALAFGTLLIEGTPVRLSGQDSGRGTFSQRHLTFYDHRTGEPYRPLKHIAPDQAPFSVYDSSLSEYAVMGFEFGYSIGDPLSLVLWEAQFGDFVNGAQIMIDQFLSVSTQKWGQPSGMVLLLPHGYEGQGPEHSSARIERFLILSAEENWYVVNATTPAQYFHVLRRQMRGGADARGVRKPLILFTPKSLLRHPKVMSRALEFTGDGFHEVIGDSEVNPDHVSRILICSGKIYYDLLHHREQTGAHHVAIIRLEQLYPFPATDLQDQIDRYPAAADIAWVQEEPLNMGGWRLISDCTQPMLDRGRRRLRFIGRPESASPASGSYRTHEREQKEIIEAAFAEAKVAPVRKVRVVRRRTAK